MDQKSLLDAHVQLKRTFNLLGEVQNFSTQMAEALDRSDQVTTQMLISMRREPILKLQQARAALQQQLDDLPEEDADRLAELLNGAPAEEAAEEALADQVAANARLLRQVVELDESLSLKIARDKSFYYKPGAGRG